MWPFKRKKNTVTIGGEQIEVKPLSLPAAIELVLIMAPYWPIIDQNLPRIEQALLDKDRAFLTEIFFVLRDQMRETPGDITRVVAILIGAEYEWLATRVSAAEILGALPVLDEVHDFRQLHGVLRGGSVYLGK
jgi:hypothetical protein